MSTSADFEAICGLCGTTSRQPVLPPTCTAGVPDLDGRLASLVPANLRALLAACPSCGYVAGPTLGAPHDGADVERARALVASDAYRRVGAGERGQSIVRCLRRATLERAWQQHAAVGWTLVHAAWQLEDASDRRRARALRVEAVASWRAAREHGQPIASRESGFEQPLIAETLRRAGRFGECLDECAALAAEPRHRTPFVAYVAERAWRGDSRSHSFGVLENYAPVGDPSSRRVPPLGDADLAGDAAVHDTDVDDGTLRLVRLGAGSVWTLDDGTGPRQLSVFEAHMSCLGETKAPALDVLEATATELEYLDADGGWRATLGRPHPAASRLAQGLWAEWVLALRRCRACLEPGPERVDLRGFERLVDDARAAGDAFEARVGGSTPGLHREAIARLLRYAVCERARDTVATIEAPGDVYLQLMALRSRTRFYLEAVDTEYQFEAPLSHEQRQALARLGWADTRATAVPYPDAEYAAYWIGGNLAREIPYDADPDDVAALLAETLHVAYGVAPDAELTLRVFDHAAAT